MPRRMLPLVKRPYSPFFLAPQSGQVRSSTTLFKLLPHLRRVESISHRVPDIQCAELALVTSCLDLVCSGAVEELTPAPPRPPRRRRPSHLHVPQPLVRRGFDVLGKILDVMENITVRRQHRVCSHM